MGPFVPTVISDQLNLVVALVIGIAFGYVLEQAGFSSAKRLVGLFYGYDFTVLRVFFTAAITACVGTILLGLGGYLDLSAIFVNPLFLKPAIVGGVIMGAGFIVGGYCPGTSVAAASIGKVDAMVFVLGGVLGVLGYAEVYPTIAKFVDGDAMGPVKVYESIGLSQGLFVFLLIAMAVFAFVVTGVIERKVGKEAAPSRAFSSRNHIASAVALFAVGAFILFAPDRQSMLLGRVADPAYAAAHPVEAMSPDELALRLVNKDRRLRVYDLRDEKAFAATSLPGSMNVKLSDLFGALYQDEFAHRHVKKVLVAGDQAEAERAVRLLGELGYVNLAALEGGFPNFKSTILTPGAVAVADPVVRQFRDDARTDLERQIREAKAKGASTKKTERKIQGGC